MSYKVHLDPCPFCGNTNTAQIIPHGVGIRRFFIVRCVVKRGGCGASVTGKTRRLAEMAWNRNPPDTRKEETIDANIKNWREALENSNGLLEELAVIGEWGESAREQIAENNAALAKPPRNCDVGTAEDQNNRFREFCEKYPLCEGCKMPGRKSMHDIGGTKCVLAWSQMPYEEGGAK